MLAATTVGVMSLFSQAPEGFSKTIVPEPNLAASSATATPAPHSDSEHGCQSARADIVNESLLRQVNDPGSRGGATGKTGRRSERIGSPAGLYLVDKLAITRLAVERRNADGSYVVKGYVARLAKGRRDNRGRQLGKAEVSGRWYPDTQQFYAQSRRIDRRKRCSSWSRLAWTSRYVPARVGGLKGSVWRVSGHFPAHRRWRPICLNRKVRLSDCRLVKCNEWSKPPRKGTNSDRGYLVRGAKNAARVFERHYGAR